MPQSVSNQCEFLLLCSVFLHFVGNFHIRCTESILSGKGKIPVLDIALLHDEHMLIALQSRKWQLIGMS